MWMKILETLLLSGCLAVTTNAIAPESDPAIYVVPLVEEQPEEEIVDQKELRCLQKNIYFEARNQGREGMRAVAAVTLNRVNDPRFPDTVCGVVYQRSQFSWANRGDRNPYLRNHDERKAWSVAGEIAERALLGTMLDAGVAGSQYFHARHVKPSWTRRFSHVATVGDHAFYHQTL